MGWIALDIKGGFFLFIGTNWKFKRNQNTIVSREHVQPKGNQERLPIWGLTFHVTTKLLRVIIRPLTYSNRIEFFKDILVGNVQAVFKSEGVHCHSILP
jgi:hypothetical protein